MDTKIVAPYILRAYAWEVLKANTGMRETQYGGKVPIVPLGDDPDIKGYGLPYLIYAYSESSPNKIGARSVGNMAFAISAPNFGSLAMVSNVLARTFERADQSATDVNEFSSTIPSFVGIRFGSIELSFVDINAPADVEGEEMQGVVNIRYEYYTNYDALITSVAHWDTQNQEYVKN